MKVQNCIKIIEILKFLVEKLADRLCIIKSILKIKERPLNKLLLKTYCKKSSLFLIPAFLATPEQRQFAKFSKAVPLAIALWPFPHKKDVSPSLPDGSPAES